MSVKAFVSSWWRIAMLVILVSIAVYAIFIPGGLLGTADSPAAVDNESDDIEEAGTPWHNLVFGLGLDGGARISAPPVGMMVDDIELAHGGDPGQAGGDLDRQVFDTLSAEYSGLEAADTTVRYDEELDRFTAEVFNDDVSEASFAAALSEAGVDVTEDDVAEGVTDETREEMITVIESKLNEAGLAGGQAFDTETLGGQHFIVSEAPGYTSGELQSLLAERGAVEVRAFVPDPDGDGQTNITMLEQGDFDDISGAQYDSRSGHHVMVSIVADGTEIEYEETMNEIGFTTEGTAPGGGLCDIPRDAEGNYDFSNTGEQWCLLTVSDGEVVGAHGLNPDLAETMRTNEWRNSPTFIMGAGSSQEATQLSINLRAGVMTAPLDFGNAQVFSVEPALAEQFKQYSLVIGVLAILSVSGMVYIRYRDPRVALPMIVTALAEVVILLGFAAAIRMPLDLAHVAGFIAVVGTGVDDLIIIADEVMDEGDVSQRRVFDSRFRKAFWIIGAAAATTIIAMSPLAVLSLGDLQGFAIVTILGVLIGVLITRPAYGDILRKLLTDKR